MLNEIRKSLTTNEKEKDYEKLLLNLSEIKVFTDKFFDNAINFLLGVSENKNKNKAAIASKLSAKIYNLEILESNIEDEKSNVTRFLIMGSKILQPELKNGKYITSFLFKLKSKPAALYQSLGGFAINGVNLTKLQSYPEKNSFTSYFFLCDLDGHIEDQKVKKDLINIF